MDFTPEGGSIVNTVNMLDVSFDGVDEISLWKFSRAFPRFLGRQSFILVASLYLYHNFLFVTSSSNLKIIFA